MISNWMMVEYQPTDTTVGPVMRYGQHVAAVIGHDEHDPLVERNNAYARLSSFGGTPVVRIYFRPQGSDNK